MVLEPLHERMLEDLGRDEAAKLVEDAAKYGLPCGSCRKGAEDARNLAGLRLGKHERRILLFAPPGSKCGWRDGPGDPTFPGAGTFEAEGQDGLKDSERKSLRALETFGENGAKASEWQRKAEELEVKRRSFYNALNELKRKGLVLQENHRYFAASASKCNGGAMHENAPSPDASATGAAAFKAAPDCTTGGEPREHSLSCECDECMYGEV